MLRVSVITVFLPTAIADGRRFLNNTGLFLGFKVIGISTLEQISIHRFQLTKRLDKTEDRHANISDTEPNINIVACDP